MVDTFSSVVGQRRVVTVLTSGTSWTVPTNIAGNIIWVTACAGGGGGGNDTTTTDGGGGGGGGACCVGYACYLGPSPPSTITYQIGAGGAGGASGGLNAGSAGTDTIFGEFFTLNNGAGGTSSGAGGDGGSFFHTSPTTVTSRNFSYAVTFDPNTDNFISAYGNGAAADSYPEDNTATGDLGHGSPHGRFWGGGGGGGGAQLGTVGTYGGASYAAGGYAGLGDGAGGGGSLGSGGSTVPSPDISPGWGGGGAGSTDAEGGQAGGDGVIIIEYWME
jgi:hypothetical protein